jgi:hypothetical protein
MTETFLESVVFVVCVLDEFNALWDWQGYGKAGVETQ